MGWGRDEVQVSCWENLSRTHEKTGRQLHPWGATEEGAREKPHGEFMEVGGGTVNAAKLGLGGK